MNDWSRALATAFQRHLETSGFGGLSGLPDGNRKKIKNLGGNIDQTSLATQWFEAVLPNDIPGPPPPRQTTQTTGSGEVVCGGTGSDRAENLAKQPPETAQTSKTTANDDGSGPIAEDGEIAPAGPTRQDWAEGIASLDPAVPLRGFSARRWRQLIDNGRRFLEAWEVEAARLGWTTIDLFGVHPGAPAARYDIMGLVPMIGDGEVVVLAATHATLRKPSGSRLTYLRRPQPGAVPIWNWGRR